MIHIIVSIDWFLLYVVNFENSKFNIVSSCKFKTVGFGVFFFYITNAYSVLVIKTEQHLPAQLVNYSIICVT